MKFGNERSKFVASILSFSKKSNSIILVSKIAYIKIIYFLTVCKMK